MLLSILYFHKIDDFVKEYFFSVYKKARLIIARHEYMYSVNASSCFHLSSYSFLVVVQCFYFCFTRIIWTKIKERQLTLFVQLYVNQNVFWSNCFESHYLYSGLYICLWDKSFQCLRRNYTLLLVQNMIVLFLLFECFISFTYEFK